MPVMLESGRTRDLLQPRPGPLHIDVISSTTEGEEASAGEAFGILQTNLLQFREAL